MLTAGGPKVLFEHVGFAKRLHLRQQALVLKSVNGISDDDWKGYEWPNVAHEEERRSFDWHTKRANVNNKTPSPAVLREATGVAEIIYAPARWSVPDEPFSFERGATIIANLNGAAVPGPAWTHIATTNNKLLLAEGGVDEMTSHYFRLFAADFKGWWRVFSKQEPTKVSKLREGRQRLIWGPDWVRQVRDAFVFDPLIEAEKKAHHDIPSKIGMAFYGGEWDSMIRRRHRPGEIWLEMDKSQWDWTVPQWLFETEKELTRRLGDDAKVDAVDKDLFWAEFDAAYDAAQHALFQLSDGTLYQQKLPGIVKSGWKRTISFNSKAQVLLRVAAELTLEDEYDYRAPQLIAMGDDTCEPSKGTDWDEAYVNTLNSWGFTIKDGDIHHGELPSLAFCGHRTVIDRSTGLYVPTFVDSRWGKHSYQLTHVDKSPDEYAQLVYSLCYGYAFSDKLQSVLKPLLSGTRWDRSVSFFQDSVRGFGTSASDRVVVPAQKHVEAQSERQL